MGIVVGSYAAPDAKLEVHAAADLYEFLFQDVGGLFLLAG